MTAQPSILIVEDEKFWIDNCRQALSTTTLQKLKIIYAAIR